MLRSIKNHMFLSVGVLLFAMGIYSFIRHDMFGTAILFFVSGAYLATAAWKPLVDSYEHDMDGLIKSIEKFLAATAAVRKPNDR